MKREGNKRSLNNYIRNNYSRSDYRQVINSFSQDESAGLKEAMQDHWEKLPVGQPLDNQLSVVLKSLKNNIINGGAAKKWSFYNFYQKVAAVLFIPLLLGISYLSFYLFSDQTSAMAAIHSPVGARTEFVLPDGTSGWLNSGSELSYPVNFESNRFVHLDGQAFFNVAHQHGKKFLVKTSNITIQVLGTSFDVSAYKNDPEIDVVLLEGNVKVQGHNRKGALIMEPDQKLNIDKRDGKATISLVNAREQISWTEGVLRFNGEPLSEVMKKLARWYNVDFEIRDEQLKRYNFKATFKDEQLDEILRMIALTTPMKYEIKERETNEDGIYVKKRIMINKK
jgi:ferric-dicitrate binding protein FerR (iron transport regulator)